MAGKFIMALDQGTTSSRCIIYDRTGQQISVCQKEFRQIYPQAGWVEHDPVEIWQTQLEVAREAMRKIFAGPEDIDAIGITNQRETTIVWDKETGRPVYNAIVWQCRRTAGFCDELKKEEGLAGSWREKTGLLIDAYFSATKLRWILDHVGGAKERAARGELLFGTVETWLIWKLTGGRVHVTDYSNASRTMMFNIRDFYWDQEILQKLEIPQVMLPEARPSSEVYGETDAELFGQPIPIAGAAGDQQAALFGQACFEEGQAKNTYGTGGFMLVNTGDRIVPSKNGLLNTIAWGLDGRVKYALEGSVFVSGATIQWLRDEMQFVQKASESEAIATSIADSDGVYLVPAFTGLGAPHWSMYARGTLFGMTRGTGRAQIVRAGLESIAYQSRDLFEAMVQDIGERPASLRVDGGATANNFLMQFQADIAGIAIQRPAVLETTALGVALLAGLAVGVYNDLNQTADGWHVERKFVPAMDAERREELLHGWKRAVDAVLYWARND